MYLNPGRYIRVADWVGLVVDIAVSQQSRVMLLVKSPKMVWRNGGVEWLEWVRDQPNLIQPASHEDYNIEVHKYLDRLDNTETRLIDLFDDMSALDQRG